MVKMNKKLTMEEMNQVSGGMTTAEWDDYNKKYDKAMIRAQMGGDNGLLEKLKKERIVLDVVMISNYTCNSTTLYKDSGGNYTEAKPYANWKLKDMPNVELVYKIDEVARFFHRLA